MKYELFLLNNIHDSLEMVNTEFDPFLSIYDEENYIDSSSIKHIILDLSSALELLIKYRLGQKHWAFIFSDINKATYQSYLNGDFVSVDIKAGISRLKNLCEIQSSFTASIHIYQYRNHLMHYTLTGMVEQILKDISNSMLEISVFIEEEIISFLPPAAVKDFKDTIESYRIYANTLIQKFDIRLTPKAP